MKVRIAGFVSVTSPKMVMFSTTDFVVYDDMVRCTEWTEVDLPDVDQNELAMHLLEAKDKQIRKLRERMVELRVAN